MHIASCLAAPALLGTLLLAAPALAELPASAAKPRLTAPSGNGITVCPSGCDFTQIHAALRAAPAGAVVEVAGGAGPEPLAYEPFSVRRKALIAGYGQVKPLIVSDKAAGRPKGSRDDGPKVVIAIWKDADGAELRDLAILGRPDHCSGACGAVRPIHKGDLTIDGVDFIDNLGALFAGAGFNGTLTVLNSTFQGHGGNELNHGIYHSGDGTLIVRNSRFGAAVQDGNHIWAKARHVVVEGNEIGTGEGDRASAAVKIAPSTATVRIADNILRSSTRHRTIIAFNNRKSPPRKVEIVGNRFENHRSDGVAIRTNFDFADVAELTIADNMLIGIDPEKAVQYRAKGGDRLVALP